MLNISTRKVGGLRFIKIGRLCISFCVTREYRPMRPLDRLRNGCLAQPLTYDAKRRRYLTVGDLRRV